MSLTFDTPVLTLDASLDAVNLIDPAGMPSRVIDTNTGFRIDVAWSLTGSAIPYLGGTWTVRALVESMGAGFEGQIGSTTTVPVDGSSSYTVSITVPAGTVPPPAGDDTVYKLVVLVSHTSVSGTKTEMAGFGEGPFFEVRNP